MAVTHLGRGDHSLQPDPFVTHLGIEPRGILAAWQLWGEGIKTLFRLKTTSQPLELISYCLPIQYPGKHLRIGIHCNEAALPTGPVQDRDPDGDKSLAFSLMSIT